MIFDEFKNINLYNIDEKIKTFILNLDPETAPGRYDITDGAYVNIEEYNTKDENLIKLEGHKKHIDIQFVIKGKERVYTTNLNGLEIAEKYNEEKDIEFYKNPKKPLNVSYLEKGKFIVLYPDDIHSPCINYSDENEPVKKAVVKILI